ncbi:MAG TPA: sigma 54-interacting transcriptional regulator [Kofleriaceae bacterium]|nr:sigma 54-interacting transcriptional regulator [Kofleriaceae bacterium]
MSAETTVTLHRGSPTEAPARKAPHLFLALECTRPLALSARYSLEGIDVVVIGRGPERSAEHGTIDGRRVLTVRVPDPSMSHTHVRLERGLGYWVVQDTGSKNGTMVDGLTVRRARLDDGALITLGYTLFLFRLGLPVLSDEPWVDAGEREPAAPGLLTLVPELERELARLVQVAPSTVTVTIRGETGTGKEVLARAVHRLSRRPGEFVAVNCGALSDALVESELFGHKKGSFSGAATDHDGLVRSADRGTLLLDEIGDLPPASQAALLRVLQEHEVLPVGSTRPVPVELRVISATHRDLEGLVDSGRFRADLLARVAGFRIDLPPMRERREDLGLLIGTLIERLCGAQAEQVALTEAAVRALYRHDWPHNVRELEKCLAAALILAAGQPIDVTHLSPAVAAGALDNDSDPAVDEEALRARLVELLAEYDGNVSAVSRAMGKARMQIHRWMKRFGLEPDSYRLEK